MTLHKDYISKAYLSPEYRLDEVTYPSESRLSVTMIRGVIILQISVFFNGIPP